MAKSKTAFVCSDCGAEFARWQGQCGECKEWNTISEIKLAPKSTKSASRYEGYAGRVENKVQTLDKINLQELPRFSTGYQEFDRVLGGGVVPGSAILIGGSPGAGKSTLLLQTMCYLSEHMTALYVTGELYVLE